MICVEEFDPKTCNLVETQQIRYLREVTGVPDLFMLHFDDPDNWSVCVWLNKLKGEYQTLLLLHTLNSMDQHFVQNLVKWAKGKTPTQEEAIRAKLKAEREKRKKDYEDQEEAREVMKFLGRRLAKRYGAHAGIGPAFQTGAFPVRLG